MPGPLYLAVFVPVVLGVLAASAWSARAVASGADFTVAGRTLGPRAVTGAIVGTLVGGASTVGTVEMAYRHGVAAWYFTLGSGLACLLLALVFARALRESGVVTVGEFLGRAFGPRFRTWASLATAAGMFVHVVAQLLAATAVLGATFGWGPGPCLGAALLLHGALVLGGGMVGAAWLGRVKLGFLYGIMGCAAGVALWREGGPWALARSLPPGEPLLSLFGYGVAPGLRDLLAVVVGVLATQTYLQALFAARDVRAARDGALWAAALIPPVGALGVVVGLHLRVRTPGLASCTAQALPQFLDQVLPEPLAALCAAGLLLIVLGTGAGLALGVTTTLSVDVLGRHGSSLVRLRAVGAVVVALAGALVWQGLDTAILSWSYLSMGLRGAAVLPGLLLVVALPGRTFGPAATALVAALPLAWLAAVLAWR